jgi:Lrp/AsnC family leucine-responsive transcriptional regulator
LTKNPEKFIFGDTKRMLNQKKNLAMKLDHYDRKILDMLQADARTTTKEIAAALKLTVTPTYERIKRLEKSGYILQYVALVDNHKVGKQLTVLASINLKEHSREYLDRFVAQITPLPEVMECYYVAGSFDYILKVMVNDMAAYQNFLVNKLAPIENIGHVQSHFVMTEVKHSTAIPM